MEEAGCMVFTLVQIRGKIGPLGVYSPELNPAEKIGAFIKKSYKNRVFQKLENVKTWLHNFIKHNLNPDIVKSITHNNFF